MRWRSAAGGGRRPRHGCMGRRARRRSLCGAGQAPAAHGAARACRRDRPKPRRRRTRCRNRDTRDRRARRARLVLLAVSPAAAARRDRAGRRDRRAARRRLDLGRDRRRDAAPDPVVHGARWRDHSRAHDVGDADAASARGALSSTWSPDSRRSRSSARPSARRRCSARSEIVIGWRRSRPCG